jgi:hypothetical protein
MAEVFLNHEAAVHACNANPSVLTSDQWISTHMSTWQEHADELIHNNIILKTWEMPNMYLTGHEHVFKTQFQLLPKWSCEAQRILDAAIAKTFPGIILESNSSWSEVVNIISIHVRRTDYLEKLGMDPGRPWVSGKYLMDLVDSGYKGIVAPWAPNVSKRVEMFRIFTLAYSHSCSEHEAGPIF